MDNGWYVLTRRFSAKEENRRIVAALHTPERIPGKKIGFENHLNVFHKNKRGLEPSVAKGLSIFLNSTLLDLYFRQFSGHTQVNAADLRMIRYPNLETLKRLGEKVTDVFPDQEEIDRIIEEELRKTAALNGQNPVQIKRRTGEALSILKALGFPRSQLNERSALTFLALVN